MLAADRLGVEVQLERALGDGSRHGVAIEYSREGEPEIGIATFEPGPNELAPQRSYAQMLPSNGSMSMPAVRLADRYGKGTGS